MKVPSVAQEVRRYGTQNGFALGSGNSILSYIPVENYLAMLDEALKEGL